MHYINFSDQPFISHYLSCESSVIKTGDLIWILTKDHITPHITDLVKKILSHKYIPTSCCMAALDSTHKVLLKRNTPQSLDAAVRVNASLKLTDWVNSHTGKDRINAEKVFSSIGYTLNWCGGVRPYPMNEPKAFPIEIFERPRRLSLSGVKILHVEEGNWLFEQFARLTCLTQLGVMHFMCDSMSLPAPLLTSLQGLPHLRILSFTDIPLETVPPELKLLTQLQSLRLKNNYFLEHLSELPPLEELTVENPIKSIYPPLQVDEYVFMTNKVFYEMDEGDSGLQLVKGITFETPNLEALPKAVSTATSLNRLAVVSNTLKSLSPLKTLTNLEELLLSKSIPADIVDLDFLQILTVEGTMRCTLPGLLTKLTSLTRLEIANQNAYLDASIGQMTGLQVLKMHYNPQRVLPEAITQLTKLSPLCRQYLLNNSPATTSLAAWPESPYEHRPLNNLLKGLDGIRKYAAPSPTSYKTEKSRETIAQKLMQTGSITHYEIQKGCFQENAWRTIVQVAVPVEVHYDFIMSHNWAYAVSEEEGKRFEAQFLPLIHTLLERDCPAFVQDEADHGDAFTCAFFKGKFFHVEPAEAPIIDVKSVWLPESDNGEHPTPDRKRHRDTEMHLNGLVA